MVGEKEASRRSDVRTRELPGTQSSGPECSRQRKQDLCGPGVSNELEVTEKPKGQCDWREVGEVRGEQRLVLGWLSTGQAYDLVYPLADV